MTEQEPTKELSIPKDSLCFIPLGGVGEIGINFYLYHYKGKWLIVDLGIGFPGDTMLGVDVLLPDPSFIEKHKKDILGLIVTHAHEDHIGGISYLWKALNCPVYASPFAAEMLERKLDESCLAGRVPLLIINKGDVLNLGPFTVEVISQIHSIPEASALAITTDKGIIVHSGDWKFEEKPLLREFSDINAFRRISKKGVLAFVGDSTNVFTENAVYDETDLRESFVKLFASYSKHIVVTCFASNVARIESISYAAARNGRKVCLMGRSLWRVEDAARASGYLENTPDFISEEDAEELNPCDVLYICTGSQGEPYSALSHLATPGMRYPHLSKGDVVIFSSRVIPGNEYSINRVKNRFLAMGAEIITEREALVHVSGHPSRNDMKKLYHILKPRIAVPVHGDLSHLLEHVKLAEECRVPFSFALKDGSVLEIDSSRPQVLGEIETGLLAVDGNRIVSVADDVFKKRKRIIESGSAVVTVVINKKHKLVTEPQISSFDLLDEKKDDISFIQERIKLAIESMEENRRDNDEAVREVTKVTLRRCLMESHGKKPLVDVHLIRV